MVVKLPPKYRIMQENGESDFSIFLAINNDFKALKELNDIYSNKIKNSMRNDRVYEHEEKGARFILNQSSRKYLDQKALKSAYPQLVDTYSELRTSNTLHIHDIKREKEK